MVASEPILTARSRRRRHAERFLTIRKILVAGYIAMALLAAFIGYTAYHQSDVAKEANEWVAHTHKVIRELEELVSTIQQAESDSRGFMLTGNAVFLKTYDDAVGQLNGRLARVRELTQDNPRQQQNLDRLGALIGQKRRTFERGIEERRTAGLASIAESVSSLRGKRLMDDIKSVMRDMMSEEPALLQRREQRDTEADRRNRVTVLFAIGLALLVGLSAGVVLLRYIDHRQKAEARLAEESSLLSTTIENISQAISVFDAELKLIAWNRHFETMLDHPSGLLRIGTPFRDILENRARAGEFGPAETESFVTSRLEQARSGVPHSFERTRSNGQIIETRGQYTPDGKLVTTYTDVTTRRQTEEKLRRLSVFQQSILDSAASAIIATDAEGNVTLFNKEAERLLGYSPEEVIGSRTLATFLKPKEVEDLARQLSSETGRRISAGFEVLALPARESGAEPREWTFVRKDGTFFPALLSMSLLRGSDGIFGYIGLASDISAQKAAEREIRDTAARLTAVLDNALDGIITINESGSIESFSAMAEKIFGYRSDEVLRRNIKVLMPEPYRSAHDGYLRHYQSTGERRIIGSRREVEGMRKDGTVFPMEVAINEMWLGARRLFVGIVRDITEQKKVERIKNEFVSTVSHELRTPLTSIAGSLGLLVGGAAGSLPARAGRLVDIAHNNSKRLVRLVNDILDIEKIESGKMTFDFSAVPLRPLVEQCIEANRGYAETYDVRFELDPAAADSVVLADPDRLTQVVTNLLSNAAKFSPAKGRVEVGIERQADRVRLSVRDHGPGIPEEFRNRIFQKFAQADSSDTRQKGGTGLGLAIVRSIVERHGGSVDFESAVGEGTTFSVRLPIWREIAPGSNESLPSRGLDRILVCEDDPDSAFLFAMMLQRAGFDADIAHSAEQAMAKLSSGIRYAVLLLDVRLPNRDGISLIRELRRHADTRSLPIIIASAHLEEGRRLAGVEMLGIADWLDKPIDSQRLVQSVQAAILSRRTDRPRILHVEDDRDVVDVVRVALAAAADVSVAETIQEARDALKRGNFDLVILDLTLPDGSGLDLLPLRDDSNRDIPAIIFSAQEADGELAARVSAALVKSRASIDELVSNIKLLIEPAKGEAAAVGGGD
jgi:PAS domain S-box-containing protein